MATPAVAARSPRLWRSSGGASSRPPRTGSRGSLYLRAGIKCTLSMVDETAYTSMYPNDAYSLRYHRRIRSLHLAQSSLQGLQFKHARAASAPQREKAAHRRPGGGACSTGKMPSRASTSASLMSLRLGTLRWRGIEDRVRKAGRNGLRIAVDQGRTW